ncbi:unnamed protein product [Cochlearia groenlandica]
MDAYSAQAKKTMRRVALDILVYSHSRLRRRRRERIRVACAQETCGPRRRVSGRDGDEIGEEATGYCCRLEFDYPKTIFYTT